MRYLGGKSRIAKKIATEHLLTHPDRSVHVEPFVGGGAVLDGGGGGHAGVGAPCMTTPRRMKVPAPFLF